MDILTTRPQFFRSKPVHLVEGGALRHFFRSIPVHFAILFIKVFYSDKSVEILA